jgi:hypothetical protein
MAQDVVLLGQVKNAFTRKAVPGVRVSLMEADSTLVVDSIPCMDFDNSTIYFIKKFPRKRQHIIIRAEHPDFETTYLDYEVKNFGRNRQINLPDILMERKVARTVELNEIVVQATKIKMIQKGDTIVYDATAFKLPEGSMLDDLIRELPGAELKANGEIFVNGEKIDYLMLNSRDFFRGNNQVMLRNLPYYTVQKINVFHHTTDLSAFLGRDVERKEHVMDVQLKREYRKGYLGNVEVGGGTNDTYMARAFGLRFTDNSRLSFFANTNNVNDTGSPLSNGQWMDVTSMKGAIKTKNVGGEYFFIIPDETFRNTLQTNVSGTKTDDEARVTAQKFLADGSTSFSRSQSISSTSVTDMNVRDWFQITKKWWVSGSADFNYHHNHNTSTSAFASSNADISLSDTLSSQTAEQYGEGHNTQLYSSLNFTRKLAWGDDINLSINYNHESAEHQMFGRNYSVSPILNDYRHNYDKAHNSDNMVGAKIAYTVPLLNGPALTFTYAPQCRRTTDRDNIFRLDQLMKWSSISQQPLRLLPSLMNMLDSCIDFDNTYNSKYRILSQDMAISITWQRITSAGTSRRMELNVPLTLAHERMDYQRGQLDTLCHRNYSTFNPSLTYESTWKDDMRKFTASSSWKTKPADINQTIAFLDNRNPLAVIKGNPNLKQTWIYSADVLLTMRIKALSQMLSFSASVNAYGNLVTNGFTYSRQSGVYVYRPENVNGNWDTHAGSTYSISFGKERNFKFENSSNGDYIHSVNISAVDDASQGTLSKVNTTYLQNKASLTYSKDALNINLSGSIALRHTASNLNSFTAINAKDFVYGINGHYTIPHLNTTISLDGNIYSRRGYGSSYLNKDYFVLKAYISQSFFKGKFIVRIEGFDLLHQLSSTQYEVNAQGRTETWYRSLPNYVMLHLVYHWNKNPKKK